MGIDHMTDINIFQKSQYIETYEIKLICQFSYHNLGILHKNPHIPTRRASLFFQAVHKLVIFL